MGQNSVTEGISWFLLTAFDYYRMSPIFFLILCFANDNIDKIKSNHNLNIFINIIFIIIFFVFLFQISLWLLIYVLWFWEISMTVLNRHLLLPDLQWKSIAAFRTIRHFTWDPSMAFKQRYVRIWHWSYWGFKQWSCIFTTSYIITVCFSWLRTLEVFFKYPEDPWDSSVRGDCLSVSVSLKKCLFNFARLSLTLKVFF